MRSDRVIAAGCEGQESEILVLGRTVGGVHLQKLLESQTGIERK